LELLFMTFTGQQRLQMQHYSKSALILLYVDSQSLAVDSLMNLKGNKRGLVLA